MGAHGGARGFGVAVGDGVEDAFVLPVDPAQVVASAGAGGTGRRLGEAADSSRERGMINSPGSSEKNSPVPPAANSTVAPYGISHSRRAA